MHGLGFEFGCVAELSVERGDAVFGEKCSSECGDGAVAEAFELGTAPGFLFDDLEGAFGVLCQDGAGEVAGRGCVADPE